MTQRTNNLRLVSKIISEDHSGLEMANNQVLGNQHERKTKEKFKKAGRLKLSEQWQDLNYDVKTLLDQLLSSLGWS